MEDDAHAWHNQPPYYERTQAGEECVFQSDDVTQSQYGCTCVHLEHELRLVGKVASQTYHTGCEVLVPPSQTGYDEVVKTTHQSGDEQGLSLVAALGSAHQHLRGGCGLWERIFTVHIAYEVLAERNQKQNSQHASQGRSHENLHKRSCHFRIFSLQDVDGWQGEDGSCHHGTRAGSDALDDDVLAQRLASLGGSTYAHGDDGDWDGCLEYLTHLQAQIGCGGRENDRHHDTPCYRPSVHLGINLVWRHQRLVFLPILEFAECVLGELQIIFFFHYLLL